MLAILATAVSLLAVPQDGYVDIAQCRSTQPLADLGLPLQDLAFDSHRGVLCGVAGGQFLQINTESGTAHVLQDWAPLQIETLAYSTTLRVFYGVDANTDTLYEIGLSGGTSQIGALGGVTASALAYEAPTQTLLAIEALTSRLVSIDTETGLVSSLGVTGIPGVTGMEYNAATSTLYAIGGGVAPRLYIVDPITARSHVVHHMTEAMPEGFAISPAQNLGYVMDGSELRLMVDPPAAGEPFCSIGQAIDDVPDGAIIRIAPGTYAESLELGSKSLHLYGTGGASATVVQADGGSVVHGTDSTVVLEGLTLTGGQGLAPFDPDMTLGGGVFFKKGDLTLKGCIVADNQADFGAGLYVDEADLTLANTVVARNVANGLGGGFLASGQVLRVLNSTVTGNLAPVGGAIALGGWTHQALTLSNSILWDNGPQPLDLPTATVVATFCNIEHGFPGNGNLDVDPLFRNPSSDYRLPSGSPCVDAGNSLDVDPALSGDIRGLPRILDDWDTPDTGSGQVVVDMGAFELATRRRAQRASLLPTAAAQIGR